MKTRTIFFLILLMKTLSSAGQSVAGDFLDLNDVKAWVRADGVLFDTLAGLNVPKGSGNSMGAANSLWIGGVDASATLKLGAMTYRQTGVDFWPGPMMNPGSYSPATDAQWNRVWKIKQETIDSFIVFFSTGTPAGYTIPQIILDWPGNGNTALGQSPMLAPFYDANSDGIYNPAADGDYPLIRGEQAILFIFNDDRNIHTETASARIGLETIGLLYSYNSCPDSALRNTVFAHYEINNRSSFRLDSCVFSSWTDIDIGPDDHIGTDVGRGTYFFHAGTPASTGTYGAYGPAEGIAFLRGPYADANGLDDAPSTSVNGFGFGDGIPDNEQVGLKKTIGFVNAADTIKGNPAGGSEYYEFMSGRWRNGAPLAYGGGGYMTGVNADYIFPGDSDPLGYGTAMVPQSPWDQTMSGWSPNDMRCVGSFSPVTLQPGEVNTIDLAFVFGRDYSTPGNLAGIDIMKTRVDSVRSYFTNNLTPCGQQMFHMVGISESEKEKIRIEIFPNPATVHITVHSELKDAVLTIIDVTGREICRREHVSGEFQVTTSSFENGLYFITLTEGDRSVTKKFVKQ